MSIPLDRLYHYLDSVSGEDILIYRWNPHGSKKLEDLQIYKTEYFSNMDKNEMIFKCLTTPVMICHDQEPLHYDYYSTNDFIGYLREHSVFTTLPNFEEFVLELSKRHLRSVTQPHNVFEYMLLCHSEKNSDQLAIYEKNRFIGVYYWAHALIARDWFRFAEHDLSLTPNFENINYDFLVYNRAWSGTREYRLKFSEMIVDCNLDQNCNIKFNTFDSNIHYTNHVFKNKNFEIKNTAIELTLKQNTSQSWASAEYSSADYSQSAIEVVLETLFDDSRNHLTEKILRPIACGRPFILVGTPASLGYLREYGFKTFDGLIDESYDCIADPVKRLQFIIKEMKRISQLSHSEKINFWTCAYDIAEYNKTHFFSTNFHNFVTNEFVENFTNGFNVCQSQIGQWWKYYKSVDTIPETRYAKMVDLWLEHHNKSF